MYNNVVSKAHKQVNVILTHTYEGIQYKEE